jgi:DNA-binding response OmpR family regulator
MSDAPELDPSADAAATEEAVRRVTLLVYSSDARIRERVQIALGRRPGPGLEVEFVEAATGEEVIVRCDEGDIDLAVLDGEAAPTGGLGLCRQLKDELDVPPPVLAIVGRRDDAWLATWARADGVTQHPIDALRITESVLELLSGSTVAVVPTV